MGFGLGSAVTGAAALTCRSASTIHRRSRFAFKERAIATAAIETPGFRHAATDSALNAGLCRLRRCRPIVPAPPVPM